VIGDINDSYDNSRTSEKEIETRRRGWVIINSPTSKYFLETRYTQRCCWKFSSCLLSKIKCRATYLYSANELVGIESERHE